MNIYAYGDGGVSEEVRLRYPLSQMIASKDFDYILHTGTIKEGSRLPLDKDGIYIFSRPMATLNAAILSLKQSGAKIIIDVDDNFWAIPKSHVGYTAVGPGSKNIIALEMVLPLADVVTVSTSPLAEYFKYRKFIENPVVIPNVCNSHNQYNCFPRRKSKYVRYGFSGTITHREDFKVIVKPMMQFLKEQPLAQIAIGCDPEIYRFFRLVPEQQKIFVPSYPYKYYPAQLSFFDLMLIPLVKDTFNHGKSDIKILDSIVNGKPFIASNVYPYMPYKDSGAGIVIDNDETSWYNALNTMFSEESRKRFSSAGLELAKQHHVNTSAETWKSIISELRTK